MMWPALAYLLGVWWLQQCAHLANLTDLAWMWILLLLASPKLWTRLLSKPAPQQATRRYRQLSRLWLILLAFLLGFSYANGRAYWRMQDRLAADLQGKTLQVIGVVSSLPQYQPNALRFNLDVEQVLGLPDPTKFPQHL
jgi:competence protein ComEC